MAYPEFTKADLSGYSGRPEVSYTNYALTSAVPQALLLFKIGTCLSSLDDLTPDQLQLAKFAILSMADQIYLSQQYQLAAASPFSSESIGSYSYSKMAVRVQKREETGVMWFDMATNQLSVCAVNDGIPMQGGIEIFEHDATFVAGDREGNRRFLSPAEIDSSRGFGYDPAPGYSGVMGGSGQIPSGGGGSSMEIVEDEDNSGYFEIETP